MEQDGTLSQLELELFAHELMVATLDRARVATMNTYRVRRCYWFQGHELDGLYDFASWRIFPIPSPTPGEEHGVPPAACRRYIALDAKVDAIDGVDAWELSTHRQTECSALASLFLGHALRSDFARWQLVNQADSAAPSWVRQWWPEKEGVLEAEELTDLPSTGTWAPHFDYPFLDEARHGIVRVSRVPVSCLQTTRRLRSDPQLMNALVRSARLHHLALQLPYGFESAGLALKVAALETLAKEDASLEGSGDAGRFRAFFEKYRPGHPEIAEELYGSVRSGLFHSGRFRSTDGRHVAIDFVDDSLDMDRERQLATEVRRCFGSWFDEQANSATQDQL